MPLFKYTAIARDGKEVSATEVAETELHLLEKLKRRRLLLVTSSAVKLKKIPDKVSSKFAFELTNLLSSGIVLDAALQIIAEDNEDQTLAEMIRALREMLKSGKTPADSLTQYGQFDSMLVPMIRAGENSGQLPQILEKLSQHYEKKNALKSDITAALAYPGVLVFVSITSIIGLIIYVIPTFKEIFSDNIDTLPLGTQIIFSLTDWFHAYGLHSVFGLLLCAIFIFSGFRFFPAWQVQWDRFSLTLPLAGKLLCKNYAVTFLGTLSILLNSGVPLVKALELVQQVMTNSAQKNGLSEIIKLIRQGKQLPDVLSLIPGIPSIGHRLVKVGNESGSLGPSMGKATNLLEQELKKELKSMVALLEPVIILLMGGVVGFVVVSMLLAVFSLTDFS